MTVRWKVKNEGNGPTVRSQWNDLVYLNSSNSQSSVLARHLNTKQLLPGNEYEVIKNVTLPKYITGKYNVFIHTNAYKEEFEYQSYENNLKRSVSSLSFYLLVHG